MNLPRLGGHILLWVGFLGGALVAVRSTEVPERPWSTISWPSYGVALAIALVGVVMLRKTKRLAVADSDKHVGDVTEMQSALNRLRERLHVWQTTAGKLPVHQVHQAIDEQLSDDLALFADLRESLIEVFGLPAYAAIMTEFALAERTINRIWSASADGYIDEVDACLPRAVAHLDQAIERLAAEANAAESASGASKRE